MKSLILTFTILITLSSCDCIQTVQGTILDANTNLPLPEVVVYKKGNSSTAVLTDSEGSFKVEAISGGIKCPPMTIFIKKEGYDFTQIEIPNGGRDTISLWQNPVKTLPKSGFLASYMKTFFDYEGDLSGYELTKRNQGSGGDCWGGIAEYYHNQMFLYIDSTICGDYGFNNQYFLVKNDQIQKVHSRQSSTLIGQTVEEMRFILTEKIYDFQEDLPYLYSRVDTFPEPNFNLFTKELEVSGIKDFKATNQELQDQLDGSWAWENDD